MQWWITAVWVYSIVQREYDVLLRIEPGNRGLHALPDNGAGKSEYRHARFLQTWHSRIY